MATIPYNKKNPGDRYHGSLGEDNAANWRIGDSLKPNFQLGGGVYRLAAQTYADGDDVVLNFDSAGYLLCTLKSAIEVAGDLAVDVWAFRDVAGTDANAWVYGEDQDISAATHIWQGIGGYDKTGDTFKILPINVDHALAPAVPHHLPTGGEYRLAADNYDDGDAVIAHFDITGHLITTGDYVYAEDSQHTSGEEGMFMLAIRTDTFGAATHIPAHDLDYGGLQMNAKGGLYTDLSSVLGADMSVTNPLFAQVSATNAANLVSNPIFTAVGDGTTTATVNTAFTISEAIAQSSLFTTSQLMGWDATAGTLSAVSVAVDNTVLSATPNVMVGGGIYKAALDSYDDNDAAPFHMNAGGELLVEPKGYDTGTDSLKVYEVAPISTHYVVEDIATATAQGNVTVYYYILMDGYRNLTLHWLDTPGAAGDNTYTLEGSVDPDEDGAGAGDYFDVSTVLGGAATWTTDQMVIVNTPVAFKYIRVKVVRANDGANTDGAWTIHEKRMY